MTSIQIDAPRPAANSWLTIYYFTRAAVSVAWVLTAFALGLQIPALGSALLVIYPLWDAAANYLDATRSGGLARNRTQALNIVVSLITTIAVILALPMGLNAVLAVFGAWAVLSGLLQLGTALRRWASSGAQWAMVLSGAQSALAGSFFILQSQQPVAAVIPIVAGYAAFGAIYFLASALWLVFTRKRAA
ncbi:MAG: DUF308 domain-containing protein [Candidatus Devosia phytovorans]|uniref:DUF308 domain-containing protein n=1 Tax=Candidatus Devosia phytovorans TaxID=3121372 RepID=A0AAJ5VXL6_9HYPH|nr:DUF308 domain-containing protein [Devosia sp.]WEK05342.1 MAG: DUF308 domain-containing protein [Devosia sp.]